MKDLDQFFYRKKVKYKQTDIVTSVVEIFLPDVASIKYYANRGTSNLPTIALMITGGKSDGKHSCYIEVKNQEEFEAFAEAWRLAKLAALGLNISA